MPDYFVILVLAGVALVYLALYFRAYLRRAATGKQPNRAWLRVGIIFAVVSAVLTYLRFTD